MTDADDCTIKGYWCVFAWVGYEVIKISKFNILCSYYLLGLRYIYIYIHIYIYFTSFVGNAVHYICDSEQNPDMFAHKLKYNL